MATHASGYLIVYASGCPSSLSLSRTEDNAAIRVEVRINVLCEAFVHLE